MSEDGGAFYPTHPVPGVHGGEPGASLRERFAVALAQGMAASGNEFTWKDVLDEAQLLTDEAMKRRKRDNTKRLAEGAEALKDDPLYADGGKTPGAPDRDPGDIVGRQVFPARWR